VEHGEKESSQGEEGFTGIKGEEKSSEKEKVIGDSLSN